LYRGKSDFKQGYQTRTNILQDEKGDMFRDCRSILASWRNNFPQLWNVHGVNDVRQRKIYTAQPLLPDLRALDFEMLLKS